MENTSALSLSGTWLQQRQNDPACSYLITRLVLPILAAIDTVVCLTLTCTIVPLFFWGTDHLKNCAASITLLFQSLFCSLENVGLNYERPYLNSDIPIQHFILNPNRYDSKYLDRNLNLKNPRLQQAVLFAGWNPSFGKKFLENEKNESFEEHLLSFITSHPNIPINQENVARQLAGQVASKDFINKVVLIGKSQNWAKVFSEKGQKLNKNTTPDLMKNYKQYGRVFVLRFLSDHADELQIIAHTDLELASKIINNSPGIDSAAQDFIFKNPNFPHLHPKAASLIIEKMRPRSIVKNLVILQNTRSYDWAKIFIAARSSLTSTECCFLVADSNIYGPSFVLQTLVRCNIRGAEQLNETHLTPLSKFLSPSNHLNLEARVIEVIKTNVKLDDQEKKIIAEFLIGLADCKKVINGESIVTFITNHCLTDWFDILIKCEIDLEQITPDHIKNLLHFFVAYISKMPALENVIFDLIVEALIELDYAVLNKIEPKFFEDLNESQREKLQGKLDKFDSAAIVVFKLLLQYKFKPDNLIISEEDCKGCSLLLFCYLNYQPIEFEFIFKFNPHFSEADQQIFSQFPLEVRKACIKKTFWLIPQVFSWFLKNGKFDKETYTNLLEELVSLTDQVFETLQGLGENQKNQFFNQIATPLNMQSNFIKVGQAYTNHLKMMELFGRINCWKVAIPMNVYAHVHFEEQNYHFSCQSAVQNKTNQLIKNAYRTKPEIYQQFMAKDVFEMVLDYLFYERPNVKKLDDQEEE